MPKISIIGTTSWGITLGVVLGGKGLKVGLWARTAADAARFKDGKIDHAGFDKITLPEQVSVSSSLIKTMEDSKLVILAVPSQSMRQNMKLLAKHLKKNVLIVSAAKGLEIDSGKRMSEVIAEEVKPDFHRNICVMSGPNLSQEIIQGLPAVTVVAAEDESVAKKAQKLLSAPNLCVYTNTDTAGVELGGAFKNVIALGAGMADGLGYGDNAKAAFITRGLTEMAALGVAMGANPLTFSGLAGLGDLIATCSSTLSRNHYVGYELSKGRSLKSILHSMDGVAEGVSTTLAVWNLARQKGLAMPITEKIYQVLYQDLELHEAANQLMAVETRHELSGRRWRLFSFLRRKKAANGKVKAQS